MAEANPVMEDLLENQSVSIYSVYDTDPDYARLQVASRSVYSDMPRSIQLSSKPLLSEAAQKGEVWFNRDLVEGYPMYVAPIVENGRLIALINLQNIDFQDTSLYYQNLLSIISRLIGNFIATAIRYQQAISDKTFVPGTQIYSREALEHRLGVIRTMEEDEISTYRMFIIFADGKPLAELDTILHPLIRPLDYIGAIDSSRLMLITANTDDYGETIILQRLSAAGVDIKRYADVKVDL